MADADHLDVVESLVGDSSQPVTYKLLGNKLGVDLNTAKRILYEYSQKPGKGTKHFTYALSGVARKSGALEVLLVPEEKLDEFKGNFVSCSMHVYSVQPVKIKDPELLYLADLELLRNPSYDPSKTACIVNPAVKVVPRAPRPPNPSTSAPPATGSGTPLAPKSAPPPPGEKKPETTAKPSGITGFFGKSAGPAKPVESRPSPAPAPSKPAPAAKKGKGKAGASKGKGKGKANEDDDDDIVIKGKGKKRKVVDSDSDDEDEEAAMSEEERNQQRLRAEKRPADDDEEEKKPQPRRKEAESRRVSGGTPRDDSLAGMFDDDRETDSKAGGDMAPEDEGHGAATAEPGERVKRKKWKKIVKQVTSLDEDGYLVTNDVEEMVEYTDDEPSPPPKPKLAPSKPKVEIVAPGTSKGQASPDSSPPPRAAGQKGSKSAGESKPKKDAKKGGGGQKSIQSFFTKK